MKIYRTPTKFSILCVCSHTVLRKERSSCSEEAPSEPSAMLTVPVQRLHLNALAIEVRNLQNGSFLLFVILAAAVGLAWSDHRVEGYPVCLTGCVQLLVDLVNSCQTNPFSLRRGMSSDLSHQKGRAAPGILDVPRHHHRRRRPLTSHKATISTYSDYTYDFTHYLLT